LSHKLDLDEKQAAQMARILDELKTERAQATVDDRRVLSAFADAISGTEFDTQSAQQAATRRVQSAERLRDAVVKALTEIHRVLDAEQRERLAYLIRTGALVI
jgi:Spy/CpxP family protein refolding chaperone